MENTPANILLVDDEIPLLNLMEMFLKKLGYAVEKRDRGGDAWSLFESDPDRFAVVVVDLSLPDKAGKDLAMKLVQSHSKVRILLCSGWPFEVRSLPEEVQPRFAVLQKPFLPKMLASAVEELLHRP